MRSKNIRAGSRDRGYGRGRGMKINTNEFCLRNIITAIGISPESVNRGKQKQSKPQPEYQEVPSQQEVPADLEPGNEPDVELIGFERIPEQTSNHNFIDLTDDNEIEPVQSPQSLLQPTLDGSRSDSLLYNQSLGIFVQPDTHYQPNNVSQEMLQAMPREILDDMLTTMTTIHRHNTVIKQNMTNSNLRSSPTSEQKSSQQSKEFSAQRQLIRRLDNEYELISIGQKGDSYTGAVCNFCGYIVENSALNRRALDAHRQICQQLPIELISATTQRVTRNDINIVTSAQPIMASIAHCFMCNIQSDRPHFDISTSFARYSREPLVDIMILALGSDYGTPSVDAQVCSECFTLINQFDSATLAMNSIRSKIHQKLANRQSLPIVQSDDAKTDAEIQNKCRRNGIGNDAGEDYGQLTFVDGGVIDSENDEN